MKISKEYWYNYSHKGVESSPHRQCIVRPPGLFLFNGLAIARGDVLETSSNNNPKDLIATRALQSVAKSSTVETEEAHRKKEKYTSGTSTKPFRIENYYSRFDTPANEEEEMQKRLFHEEQVQKMKYLYHDDNFVRHSSSLNKPKRKENGNLHLTDCQRLWVPSHHKTKYLQKMWEKEVRLPEDVAYNQVVSTLQRDRTAFSPSKTDRNTSNEHLLLLQSN